jgi:MFS family permease
VETLTDYITLILLVSSIFAFIILRSAHESFYENLARTLSIAEMLGLTRKRKRLLFLMLYGMILPLATLISLGIAGIIVESMKRIPEAAEFQFFFSALPEAVLLLVLIVVMAWFPIWYRMSRVNEEKESRFLDICKDMPLIQKIELYAKNSIMFLIQRDIIVPLLLSVAILMLLFSDIVFALLVTL